MSAFTSEVGSEYLQNQQKLGEFTSWLLDQPGNAERGYIASVNDAASLSTILLWHGSDSLQTEALEHAQELGITATVEQREHSLPEIDAAAMALLDAAPQFLEQGFQIEAVAAVSAESEAVTVVGNFVDDTQAAGRATQSLSASVEDLAASLVDTPIDVQEVSSVETLNGTRGAASAPFFAGGMMISKDPNGDTDKGMICSSAFGMKYGGTARTTTARHCVAPSGTWRSPNNNANYGSHLVTSTDGGMTVLSGTGGNRTFDNEWYNTQGFSKNVYNAYDVGLNDLVCTSGANSGVHCNVKITNMRYWWDDGYGRLSTIEGTQQTSGQMAATGGDSGGPVFMPYGGSFSQSVGAVGIIQAGVRSMGETQPNCSNSRYPSDKCARRVLFTSVNTVIKHGGLPGLSLLTGPQQ
ncbi:hypothetical protein [Microbacterium sp. NPDC086615]|uniref:hypothetical protein n=1 Tax=Microbacterium sp. NPDC086615 TaxID=3154865 RepID=UPI0034148D71